MGTRTRQAIQRFSRFKTHRYTAGARQIDDFINTSALPSTGNQNALNGAPSPQGFLDGMDSDQTAHGSLLNPTVRRIPACVAGFPSPERQTASATPNPEAGSRGPVRLLLRVQPMRGEWDETAARREWAARLSF